MTFIEFCNTVLKECEIDKSEFPNKTELEQLHLLLKRHCQNEFLRLTFEPINQFWNDGVMLRFRQKELKRYLSSFVLYF